MNRDDPQKQIRETRRNAQLATFVYGGALVLWGVAPAIVDRVLSGQATMLPRLLAGVVPMVVGGCFVTLALHIGRGRAWAIWASLGLSAVLLLGSVAATLLRAAAIPALFPLVLSCVTGSTCALALLARRNATVPQCRAG